MIIRIFGCSTYSNKGAQLMLAEVCKRLRLAFPSSRICVEPMFSKEAEKARLLYDLNWVVSRPNFALLPYFLARDVASNIKNWKQPPGFVRTKRLLGEIESYFRYKTKRKASYLIETKDCDALIDISGYAYGDGRSLQRTSYFEKYATRFSSRRKPVIMLPQMLGPFTKPGQADSFAKLADSVELIYARDRESFEHAEPFVEKNKLRLAPDITISCVPSGTAKSDQNPYACIVPNSKMIKPKNPQGQNWENIYLSRLQKAAMHFKNHGLDIKIVQHQYLQGDTALVKHLCENVENSEVVREFDPLVLKSVLGGARIVIGSRYHSLVSALSMGVPAIALGWAHKYDTLLSDFGVGELIYYASQPSSKLLELIDYVITDYDKLSDVIRSHQDNFSVRLDEMWDEVVEVLKKQ